MHTITRGLFLFVTVIGAVILLLGQGAAAQETTLPDDGLRDITWQLVEIVYQDGASVIVSDPESYTLLLGAEGQASVQLDCNSGGGTYTLSGDTLTFGPIMSTMMACLGESFGEEYGMLLGNTSSYSLEDGVLTLITFDGVMLKFQNAEDAPVEPEPELTDGRWTLVTVEERTDDTVSMSMFIGDYWIEFAPEGELLINADCNGASGTYTIDGDSLTIEVVASTMVYCPDEFAYGSFLDTLAAAKSYRIDGGNLIIVTAPQAVDTSGDTMPTPEAPLPDEITLIFDIDDSQSTAPESSEEPTMSNLLDVTWMLQTYVNADGETQEISTPESYTLTLLPDNAFSIRADCNTGGGSYTLEAGALKLDVMRLTRAMCPPESFSTAYIELLNATSAFTLEGDSLTLTLADGGTLNFTR